MIKKRIKDFNIAQIANSGQCFRMNSIDIPEQDNETNYSLIAKDSYLEIGQTGEYITFSCTEEEFQGVWSAYFDLDTDYGFIKKSIDTKDLFMSSAVSFGDGIRILRQDLWEMIITFIISQQNNITRIKKCVESLCTEFGENKVNFRGKPYYLFPEAKDIAKLREEELAGCNLGYRSKYILHTARAVASGEFSLQRLYDMDYNAAKKELMRLFGVGVKVAECICLFALHHIEAFPIDTHIQSILDTYYIQGFPFERYKGYAGILQQYAFYYKVNGSHMKIST